jgi:hypothetical protein
MTNLELLDQLIEISNGKENNLSRELEPAVQFNEKPWEMPRSRLHLCVGIVLNFIWQKEIFREELHGNRILLMSKFFALLGYRNQLLSVIYDSTEQKFYLQYLERITGEEIYLVCDHVHYHWRPRVVA